MIFIDFCDDFESYRAILNDFQLNLSIKYW